MGFRPRKEATSGADLNDLLPSTTVMIQAVLSPTPGMVQSSLKHCCRVDDNFTHCRIAPLNVLISFFSRDASRDGLLLKAMENHCFTDLFLAIELTSQVAF